MLEKTEVAIKNR